jgi:methylmalonyl-CoA mutase, N-terminal domain
MARRKELLMAKAKERIDQSDAGGRVDGAHGDWEANIRTQRTVDGVLKPEFWTRQGQPTKTRSEFRSGSGEFVIKDLYTPLDVTESDPVNDLGFPGQFPFTRGRDPLGPQAAKIPLKFYSGFGQGESARDHYRRLYENGSRFIVLAMDLPTQIGYDADAEQARGEVGRVGVALSTLADMQDLLDWLPLDEVRTGTVGNSISPWAFAMFYLLAKKRGIDPARMKVNLQNDPFKEYIGRGTYIFPPKVALDLSSDVVAYVCKNLPPDWEPQYHCSTTFRWGGTNVSQEVGFGIANLIAYVQAAARKGVAPEVFIPRTNLHMSSDMDLFEEVAKFRAARRLWARIAREVFGTTDPRVTSLRITVYTGANRLTAQQPLNNVVRVTMQVLAAMLGGVDTMSIPAYDEALALPTPESTRLASLTPHILNEECKAGNTTDPLGGSYYVEWLTNQIERKAREWYDDVHAHGGALACVESGYYLSHETNGLYEYQKQVEAGERTIVGVNKYSQAEEPPAILFEDEAGGEERQVARLRKTRAERDDRRVTAALAELKKVCDQKAAGSEVNIVPSMLNAVEAYASVGEIFGVMRKVFGEHRLSTAV